MEQSNLSEVDIAYEILSERKGKKAKEPIYYKDLILEIIKRKKNPIQARAHAVAEIYTLINMDSRFKFIGRGENGQGMWGLSEWYPPEIKSTRSSGGARSSANREKAIQEKKYETIQKDI